MALGGVDTGSIKPRLHARQAPRAGGIPLTPAVFETATKTGMIILAAAVLEVNSVRIRAERAATAVILHKDCAPVSPIIFCPITSASLVEKTILPRDNPPPNSRIVPQSILEA